MFYGDNNNARKILQRVDTLPLYLHAYAFHLNMRLERVLNADLLDIASETTAVASKSMFWMASVFLLVIWTIKNSLPLEIQSPPSEPWYSYWNQRLDKASIDEAVAIALKTGASSVRFYPRYEGNLRDVLSIIANDIAYVRNVSGQRPDFYDRTAWRFKKPSELVSLVKESEMESLSLLFDFANMINANEHPIDALKTMAPHITQVHIKDALIVKEPGGLGHKACISGQVICRSKRY